MTTSRLTSPKPSVGSTVECATLILGLLKTGEINPQRRIGESSLASRLQLPRAAVRSALEHLETAGLVVRRARAGTFVRDTSVSEFCDVMDIRAALETLAARQASLRASSSDIDRLGALADAVDRLGNPPAGESERGTTKLVELDLQFHLTLAELSGNSRLAATLQQQRLIEFSFALAAMPMARRGISNRSIPTHRDIVEALRTRDPADAARVMRRHILLTKEARLGIFTDESEL